ncbi:MAG: rhomboid family intramembrane serine protease [Bryobacterales bacterium]|nr:rhomboid family intramembrane serine protease [Bryobacterales bacterium]
MPNVYRNPRSFDTWSAGGIPPGVKWLLILNCGIFVLEYLATASGEGAIFAHFSLWPRAVLTVPAVWQVVTYLFLHDPRGFGHILFNMLALWMIGSDLERGWGTRLFLKFYFICGVGAGLCVVAANALVGNLDARTIGSSGAIYGLLLAFGVLYPDRVILFSFLFPIKAKYFVMILGGIAFLGSLGASGGTVSHFAHLGGMLIGLIYLKAPRAGGGLTAPLQRYYHSWKRARAKRKFELYVRRRDSDRPDRWVN